MQLLKAHGQWAARPDDERFDSLESLHAAVMAYKNTAREKEVPYSDLRVEAQGEEVVLVGKANVPARFSHWAFGQISARAEAPAEYLRRLPPTLAAQNLNHGLAANHTDDNANLLFHTNGDLLLRALTSDKYTRIWNADITPRLLTLTQHGWEPACPGTVEAIQMSQAPALYASDHDMFAFLMNRQAVIREPGTDGGLMRGVIVENSEVGASALRLTRFLYRMMCGNHIIWDASKVLEISIRHIGDADYRWDRYAAELRRYAESSASDEEVKIASAKRTLIAATKEEVLDKLFGIRKLNLSRRVLDSAYDAVLPAQDGAPNTVWGMAQGLTRFSRTIPYADNRTQVDRAAGKLLEFAF